MRWTIVERAMCVLASALKFQWRDPREEQRFPFVVDWPLRLTSGVSDPFSASFVFHGDRQAGSTLWSPTLGIPSLETRSSESRSQKRITQTQPREELFFSFKPWANMANQVRVGRALLLCDLCPIEFVRVNTA